MRMMEDLGKGSCKEEKEKVEHDDGKVCPDFLYLCFVFALYLCILYLIHLTSEAGVHSAV